MALKKTLSTRRGVDGTYWRIGAVKRDFRAQSMTVWLDGFPDGATAAGGFEPMDTLLLSFPATGDVTRAEVYAAIKSELEQFADATDV